MSEDTSQNNEQDPNTEVSTHQQKDSGNHRTPTKKQTGYGEVIRICRSVMVLMLTRRGNTFLALFFSGTAAFFAVVMAAIAFWQGSLTRTAINDAREDSARDSIMTKRALGLSMESNRLTEESLQMIHGDERPWLLVSQWGTDSTVDFDGILPSVPTMGIVIKNRGIAPALSVRYVASLDVMTYPFTTVEPEIAKPKITRTENQLSIRSKVLGIEIVGGETHWLLPYKTLRYPDSVYQIVDDRIPIVVPMATFSIPCRGSMVRLQDIRTGKAHIVCHGWVAYLDGSKTEHTTHFCFELHSEERFPAADDQWSTIRSEWVFRACPEWYNEGPPLNDAN